MRERVRESWMRRKIGIAATRGGVNVVDAGKERRSRRAGGGSPVTCLVAEWTLEATVQCRTKIGRVRKLSNERHGIVVPLAIRSVLS